MSDAIQFGDRAFAALQYALPKHALSRFIYRVMRSERRWLRDATLGVFLKNYRVDMSEALEANPYAYLSFNAFFTRALKAEARPIDPAPEAVVSPVDGAVSQCGRIEGDLLFQAKGHTYSLAQLVGDAQRAEIYRDGVFATIYLAPYNYHRIHMPYGGAVTDTRYIPGDLFSVNAATARTVASLFARNERLICEFATQSNWRFAMAYIGALFVGSMETTWCGEVNPPPLRGRRVVDIDTGRGHALNKGEEAGRFNMGSTVILLAPPRTIEWLPSLQPGATVKMGERIGVVMGDA